MKKKYKILIFIFAFILFVTYNFTILKLHQQISMFQTEKQILGTFITEENTLIHAQYFVVDQEKNAYWYQQQGFYKEGSVERLNERNVYKADFEDNSIIIVFYEDHLLLIDGDHAVNYSRISQTPQFIGINK